MQRRVNSWKVNKVFPNNILQVTTHFTFGACQTAPDEPSYPSTFDTCQTTHDEFSHPFIFGAYQITSVEPSYLVNNALIKIVPPSLYKRLQF